MAKKKKRSTVIARLQETANEPQVQRGSDIEREKQHSSREEILANLQNVAAGGKSSGNRINEAYAAYRARKEQARADRYQSLVRDTQSLFDEKGKLNSGVTTRQLGQLSQRTREVYKERTESNAKFLQDLDSYLQRLAAGQLASGMTSKLLPQEQRDALRDQIAGQAPWDRTGTRRRSGAGTTTTGSPAMQKWLTPQEQEEAAEREASGYVSPESYAASIRANEAAAQRIRARSRTGANGSHLRAADGGGSLTEQQQALVDDLMQRSARSRMEAEAEAARTAAFRGSDYWLERANELEAKNRESRSSYGGMMQGGTAFRETPEFTRAERQELDRARENYYYTKNAERWGSMPEDLRQKALEAAGYTTDSVLAWQSGDEAALAGMDPEQRAQRQRDQRARRNEIAAILAGAGYEPEEVIEYASRLRNAEQMGERTTAAADWATQNVGTGILGTVGTYATNLLSPVGAVGILAQKIFRGGAGAAEYRPVDYNTPSMYLSQGTSAIRGAVGGQMGAVGKFAYDTVNSAVDSAARMLVGRVIGAGLMPDAAASEAATERLSKFVSGFISTQMSGEVFANSFVQAKENGSTDADALLDSVTSAVIEGLTEKYSVEAILSNPNGLTWTALRNSFLSEGSEEMASDFLNTIYDELKNGDDSELRTQYRELLAGGATENDAFNRVFGDYVKQVVLDGLAGGLSGIAMSGAAELGESWRYGQSGVYSDPENAAALVREALELDPENRTALAARGRVEAGAGLTGRQAKELTRNNDARIAMQEAAGTSAVPTADEQLAEELYRQYGETAGAAAAQQNEDLAAELQREYGPVYRQNRALEAQEAAAQKSAAPADRSGTEVPAAPRQAAQEQTNGAERQIMSRTGKSGGAARQAAETGAAAQKAPAAQERKRTGYVQPAGGTPVAGTDIVRVEQAGDGGLTLLRADGSTTSLDAAKTAGTALEVLRAAEELPEYKDPLTLNGMLRAYEGYLGGGQSTPARAEDFLDSYAIALTAGAEGESRSVLAGITEDSRLRSAMETGYRRGAELSKGKRLAQHLGSAGAAALEAHGYRYPEEFGAFYQAGQEGLSFPEAKRMAGVSGLGEVRKAVFTAAWEAGRKDGNDYEETSGYDLGFEDGSRYAVSDDGGQRAAGVGARGQAGAVEEGAGGSESREGGRVGGRGAGHEGARTDLKKLGVASGTDAAQRVVRRERHDYGGEVITVSDRLEVYGADGKKTTVQAISTGKDVILREGDPMYGQHRLHELEHVRQRSMTDEEITAAFKEKTKDLPDGKVRSILRAYALDYYGLYGEDSTTMGDLYREYLADRAAGIPQKETDKAVRLPDERNAARDQRRDIYAMRGNQKPAYEEWDIQNALYDAMDHADRRRENLIRVGEMPRFVTGLTGIEGDFYLYRNHIYENMATAAEAKQAGRFDKNAHYHGLGMEKMTDAIQSLEHPIMTIATKTKDGNPAVIMLLPVKGSNGAPLYGVLSFYSNKAINGDMSRRPHVVLTIAERNFTEAGGRTGIEDVVRNGIKEGRVLSFDKTMRDDLPLTADTAGIGSITEPSLKENVARFRKEIKGFKEKNKINYSVSAPERDSAGRELSAEQAEMQQARRTYGHLDGMKYNVVAGDAVTTEYERQRKGGNEFGEGQSFAIPQNDDAKKVLVVQLPKASGNGFVFDVTKNTILQGGRVALNYATGNKEYRLNVRSMIENEIDLLGGIRQDGVFYRVTENKMDADYIRNGTIRTSKNHMSGAAEDGLSVWETPKYHGSIVEKLSGEVVGVGADGEPLLDVKSVKVLEAGNIYKKIREQRAKGRELFKEQYNWTDEQIENALSGRFEIQRGGLEEINKNENRDIRYSVSEEAAPSSSAEYAQMQRGRAPAGPSAREAAEQRKRQVTLYSHMTERAFELRRQFTEGTARDLRATDIPDVASDLLRFAGRKAMGRGELEQRLSDIAMKAARSQNPMEAYQIAKEEADYLAADMMRNATGQTDEAKDMWDGIRQTMRSGGRPVKLAITGQNRADLEREGGYEHLRKRLMGYAFLSPSGTPVEVFYEQELTPRFPTAFPDTIQNPADQLIRIVDVLDRFRQIFKSPWAGDAAEDTELLSQEILQRLYNANVQAPSAEAYAAQREEMLQAHYEQRIAETRQRMQTEMENLRRSFDEKRQGERTARQEQKDRDALLHLAQRLDRVKVGSQWKAKAAELVGNLDTIAKSMTGRTIIGDRIGNLSTEGIETIGEDDLGRKYVDIETLRDWVREMQAQNPDFMPDKRTMEKIDRLSRVQIADMDIGDVRALLNAMQNLENEMRTCKKLIDAEDRRDVAIQTAETISDIRGSKGVPLTGVKAAWNRLIINEGLSPVRFLHRVTGYNDEDPLYRATQALQKGETAMHDYTRRAEAMFRGFMEDKKFMASLAGEKARTIQITGLDESGHSLTLPITPDMQIAIFLHSFNNDNIRHAERGGFVIPDLALLRKGKVEEAYTSGTLLRLRKSQMKAVEQNMTEREVQFARAVYRYFNGMSKNELNEVSRKLLGYDVATVQNYYPIETSRDFARGEPETVKRDGTIEGSGYLKSREGAAGPINLRGVTDTLERAIAQHSKYVGLAIPIRNFGKIYGNSTWRITPTEETGALLTQDVAPSSLRRVLNQKWGAGASAYIDKLMADLQNPAKEIDAWAKTMGKVRSNYAGAVLTMNASVAIKQAASYPTAAAVVGWAPLVKAMTNWEKTDINFIAEHTPLLWYRSKGFSTQELGDMAKGKKQIPKGLNWIQGIDVATVKKLWKAAEYYVRQEQPELEVRSGAYWDAVTEIYERIVLETQPDYTTMERPQLLRSRNTLLQNLAMFKTQPFQNFNIAYDALANLQAKEQQLKAAQDEAHRFDSEETRELVRKAKENLKNAKKGASRAVSALLVSAAVFSAMTLLWNVIRGNLRRYKDKDKDKVTVESFLKTFGSDTAGSLAGILPFGSDAYEVFAALVLDQQYYGMEALTPSAISDFLEQVATLDDTIASIGKALKGDASAMDSLQTVNRLGSTASKLFGVPVENVENLMKAAAYWVMKPFMSKEEADYWYRYYTTKTTAQGRRNEDKADIYAVYRSGDRSAYESMRAAMEKWIWQANSRYQSGELTREEAQASAGETMDNAMAAQIKDEYMDGGITDAEATDLLQKIGGKDKDKAVEAVAKWHFQRDGGGKDASAAQATAYYEFAQPAGISMETFAEAWDFHNNVEGDKDSSGKTVPGSAKQKVVDYIQGLGLGREQEKALWDALKGSWKDTDTPWE